MFLGQEARGTCITLYLLCSVYVLFFIRGLVGVVTTCSSSVSKQILRLDVDYIITSCGQHVYRKGSGSNSTQKVCVCVCILSLCQVLIKKYIFTSLLGPGTCLNIYGKKTSFVKIKWYNPEVLSYSKDRFIRTYPIKNIK